jgi:signal transduction histidine kinase/CheY-like chemotaxis protein
MEQVATATSLPEVYDSALACLSETLEVERAAVVVCDSEGVMRFVAWTGCLSEAYRNAVQGYSPWPLDASQADPVLIGDVRRYPDFNAYLPVMEREHVRALAWIPFKFRSRLLGRIALYYREPHAFSDDEVAIAEVIAGHVAFAIEHQGVAQQLEQRLNLELESRYAKEFLADASRVLATTHQPADTIRHLARIVVPRLADWCVIQVVDEHGRIKPVEVAHRDPAKVDLAWSLARRWHAPYEYGTAADAVRTGKSTLVSRIDRGMLAARARDEEHLQALESLGLNSGITVPLQARGRILGALTVMSAESKKIFERQDLRFVEEIASWAALAIDNAELYRQTEDARAVAERARGRLQTLAEVHDDLVASLDPDAALRLLAKRLAGQLADYCITYAFDGAAIRRLGVAHRDPEKYRYLETLCALAPPTVTDDWGPGAVIRRGEAMLVQNIASEYINERITHEEHRDAVRHLEPRSAIFVPLRARGRTVGAIALVADAMSGRQYDADDLELAREIASHAALLVDNARLYAEAKTAIQARDDMIAVVSHDLRNPLQSISSAAAVLQLDPPGNRRSKSAAAIQLATEQMDRLLQDLLDITQIDAGQLSVNREKIDIASLIQEARTMFYPLAREKAIRLHCTVATGLPAVYVDRGRILQVLSNLLGNALKFVPSGGRIELSAAMQDGRVRIAVADTGPGIDPDNVSKVFDRFWRADRRKERGAGLGLAVARGIVQAHGGEIGVDSRPGEGSTFYILLDAVPVLRPSTQALTSHPGPILVVDDDEPFRKEIVEVLRGSGYEVISAGDSREALEYLEGESTPALVILDGMTPLMDGRSLYDAVRGEPRLHSVPLVLSSHISEFQLDESVQGAAGYLEKPVRPSQLLGLAAALCRPADNRNSRLN